MGGSAPSQAGVTPTGSTSIWSTRSVAFRCSNPGICTGPPAIAKVSGSHDLQSQAICQIRPSLDGAVGMLVSYMFASPTKGIFPTVHPMLGAGRNTQSAAYKTWLAFLGHHCTNPFIGTGRSGAPPANAFIRMWTMPFRSAGQYTCRYAEVSFPPTARSCIANRDLLAVLFASGCLVVPDANCRSEKCGSAIGTGAKRCALAKVLAPVSSHEITKRAGRLRLDISIDADAYADEFGDTVMRRHGIDTGTMPGSAVPPACSTIGNVQFRVLVPTFTTDRTSSGRLGSGNSNRSSKSDCDGKDDAPRRTASTAPTAAAMGRDSFP